MDPKIENLPKLDGCINTFSGQKFNLINPTPEMVNIDDIARGLAFKGHFSGQTLHMFSVAQHSVLVSNLCRENELKMVALLHDAAEAYIGDMVKPLKVLIPKFKEIEDNIMKVIFEKYNLDIADMPKIKKYDLDVQALEYDQFYKNGNHDNFKYWDPETSRLNFLDKFHDIEGWF